MPDIPIKNVDRYTGIMVAADLPPEYLEAAMAGRIMPVRVTLVDKREKKAFELEVRPITSEEAVMLINRYLAEGKIEFGFRERGNTYGGAIKT